MSKRPGVLTLFALALAAGAPPLPRRRHTKPRKSRAGRDDEERITAAQAKRERKNAKRIRVPEESTDSGDDDQ